MDEVYNRRDASRRRYEKDDYPENETQTWHPRLLAPPDGFPDELDQISFELEPDEASFWPDRLLKSQKDSFLAFLALNCKPVDCGFPWQHPELLTVPKLYRHCPWNIPLFLFPEEGQSLLLRKRDPEKLKESCRDHYESINRFFATILKLLL